MNAATFPTSAATTTAKSAKPCRFFQKGACALGDKCTYSHDPVPASTASTVSVPTVPASGAATVTSGTKKPCYFVSKPGGCALGDKCTYSHEPAVGASTQSRGPQKGPKDGKLRVALSEKMLRDAARAEAEGDAATGTALRLVAGSRRAWEDKQKK
jgi:hypothetical protein